MAHEMKGVEQTAWGSLIVRRLHLHPSNGASLAKWGNPVDQPPAPETTMSTESLRVGETYREKALRKFKQQPLVPLGSSTSTREGPT
jgi:hypothetical protein